MKLISVNVAMPTHVMIDDQPVLTGINKQAVSGPVWVGELGCAGDDQADKNVHGGPHQAVYSYAIEHYPYWQQFLGGQHLAYGTFGENFTIGGLDEDTTHVGDVLQIGEVQLQVTMPRIPCFKFANKVGSKAIVEPFLKSGKSGFYQRVLQAGYVEAGQSISLLSRDTQALSIRHALIMQKMDLSLLGQNAKTALESALQIPSLAPLLKTTYEQRLANL